MPDRHDMGTGRMVVDGRKAGIEPVREYLRENSRKTVMLIRKRAANGGAYVLGIPPADPAARCQAKDMVTQTLSFLKNLQYRLNCKIKGTAHIFPLKVISQPRCPKLSHSFPSVNYQL